MANKIVLVRRGSTAGMEFPLDVDTGTDLRGICVEKDGSFWVTIDTGDVVAHYRLDSQANAAREISSDRFQVVGGTVTGIWGITTDGLYLYVAFHALRSGTHRNRISYRLKSGSESEFIETDVAPADAGNRFKGLCWDGANIGFIYRVLTGPISRFKMTRKRQFAAIDNISLGDGLPSGLVMDKDGTFWTVGSDNVIKHWNKSAVQIESFTLTNSGTAQDFCDAGGGYFAVAMI